ncbi:MAG TPA: tetratricopeptide repeat protein [Verrucomicrobiae bacterium]|nr:tetratricopeptide repeat protein [Verrucomicrobiae bacterium]
MSGLKPGQPGKALAISASQPKGKVATFPHFSWKPHGWLTLLLVAVTLVAYLPALRNGFVWDDIDYVTGNPLLHSLKGLWQIWFMPGATPQYYPLTFTSLWVDYHLWQLHPLGYHLTNVLLQALDAILLWAILRRLNVPGAWLAAAIFAVHPVNVETVAWVTERKNLLAGFFYLSSALACLQFWLPNLATGDRRAASFSETSVTGLGKWKFFWLALFLYLCALLAKTAAVALPVAVLLVVWWKRGKTGWRELFPLAPFLAVGMVMGLVTVWVETHFLRATGPGWSISFLERCLIAGRAIWFYLGKLAWPHPLMFIYPRWEISAAQPLAYLPILALIAALLFLWFSRQGWARPMLVALVYFLALLFPVLSFFNVYFFRYSLVADHFQYLASIGPITLAAAGIDKLFRFSKDRPPFWKPIFCGTLLLMLGTLTWHQCGMYLDQETLWRVTIARNPTAWMAHNNLGELLFERGAVDDAIVQYQQALQINPDLSESHNDLGAALFAQNKVDEAITQYEKALQINPDNAHACYNLGNSLSRQGKVDEAVIQYQKALSIKPDYAEACYSLGDALLQQGKVAEAIAQYQRALQIKPDFAEAHNSLGNVLLQQGKVAEAITQYRRALQIKPDFVEAHANLGNALFQQGKTDEAITQYQEALHINPDNAETCYNFGNTLLQQGKVAEAIAQYQKAVQINPNYVEALNNLARVLATCSQASLRNGSQAVELAQRANQLTGDANPVVLDTLATAYAEAGRFADAVKTAQRALQLAETQSNSALAEAIRSQLEFYQAGRPFHP